MQFLDESQLICPYCGENIDILVDESAGPQTYYEDCPVCCAPILFNLIEGEYGDITVEAKRDDE